MRHSLQARSEKGYASFNFRWNRQAEWVYLNQRTQQLLAIVTVMRLAVALSIMGAISDAHAQLIDLEEALVVDFGVGTPVQVGDELRPAGALFKVDLSFGTRTLISDLGNPAEGPRGLTPTAVAIDSSGNILLLDLAADLGMELHSVPTGPRGALYRIDPSRIDPSTGRPKREVLSDFGDEREGALGENPVGLTVDATGNILVIDQDAGTDEKGALFRIDPSRIDPSTGRPRRELISDFGEGDPKHQGLQPGGVAVEASGRILVIDLGPDFGRLFRINRSETDPSTGRPRRTTLSDFGDDLGPRGENPFGLAIEPSGSILVLDFDAGSVTDPLGTPSAALFSIDPSSGARTIISDFGKPAEGDLGVNPVDVTVDVSGRILVIDQDAGTDAKGALFIVDRILNVLTRRRIISDFGRQAPLGVDPTALVAGRRVQLPLIFIPAFAGSSLNEERNSVCQREIWTLRLLSVDELKKLTLDPSRKLEQRNICVRDILRTSTIDIPLPFDDRTSIVYPPLMSSLIDTSRGRYREYLASGLPERRTSVGCDLNQKSLNPTLNPTLFVFPYDWRKNVADNAAALRDYVFCVQQFYPNSNVDILTHSMGGLVARRYILNNPGTHFVARLATIAAPWLGAPKAIYSFETGDLQGESPGILTDLFGELLAGRESALEEMSRLAKFFPATHQLLPSRSSFGFAPALREEGWDINGNGIAFEEYTYDKFIAMLNRRFPRSAPGTTGREFHDNPGQDDWRDDKSGVRYLHLVGIKKRADTIGKVVFRRWILCSFGRCSPGQNVRHLEMTIGDGTVPLFSAARTREDTPLCPLLPPRPEALNAPQAQVTVFCNIGDIFKDGTKCPEKNLPVKLPCGEATEHTALTKARAVQDEVLNFLDRVPRPTGQTASRSQIDQEPLPAVEPAFYLSTIGAARLNVMDALGNSTERFNDVPGVTAYITGEDSHLMILDPDREYTVSFLTDGNPVALEITRGTHISTDMAIRYVDLTLPVGVEARLKFNPDARDGVERLRFDANGDGTFETPVAPSVKVTGPAAGDVVPPTIRIIVKGALATTLVTFIAEDVGTGVKDIFFSLDGREFRRYTGTLRLNPTQTPVIHAFADDKVGNRSSPVTFKIRPRSR